MDGDYAPWFKLPWNHGSRAAGLAADLCRLVLPRAPKLRSIDEGHGPFRGRVEAETDDSHVELPDARKAITRALRLVEAFANGEIMDVFLPEALEEYNGDDHISRIYYTARQYGDEARQSAYGIDPNALPEAQQPIASRWFSAGEIAALATVLIQKWASRSDGGGHAYNTFLHRIVKRVLDEGLPFHDVAERVVRWRYRDALDGRESVEEYRLAFEGAWEIGRYELGYKLLDMLGELSSDVFQTTDSD
jgi:hypothetical protein